mmetsp:Transcript_15469/g.35354  ORF Transcript_15469/g.35354 Transcript_15469/m.35354 type:complete len:287 (+) Transcript_15469:64-924(+)
MLEEDTADGGPQEVRSTEAELQSPCSAEARPQNSQPLPKKQIPQARKQPAVDEPNDNLTICIGVALMLALMIALAFAFGLFRGGKSAVVQASESNFDEVVLNGGKNAFVKFHAPWCGNCKRMKPAWDQLGAEYADHPGVVIVDVDCTSSKGKPVCSTHNVRGYPTMKYFNAETGKSGQQYSQGRDLEALRQVVKERLLPCDLETLENCADHQQVLIGSMQGKGKEELEEQRSGLEQEKVKREEDFAAKHREFQKVEEAHKGELKRIAEAISVMSSMLRKTAVESEL